MRDFELPGLVPEVDAGLEVDMVLGSLLKTFWWALVLSTAPLYIEDDGDRKRENMRVQSRPAQTTVVHMEAGGNQLGQP